MYVDRSCGWVERQRAGLTETFPCEMVEKKDQVYRAAWSWPIRDSIGGPAIRGINMLNTSPARGNAFVTLGNILVPFSISILYLSFFLFYTSFSLIFLINFIFACKFQYRVIFFTIVYFCSEE